MQWKHFGIAAALIVIMGPGLASAEESDTLPVSRLDDIVVTGTRTPHALKDAPVETILINREDIERSNAQTVNDLLKTIPGLLTSGSDDVFGSGTNKTRLRGLSFNDGYGLVLIDGQRIHGSGQSGAHGEYAIGLNQIPVSMIERIEVVKGPSSVLYGSDAMAGVINVITRKIPEKTTAGAGASYGWYDVKDRVYNGAVQKPSDDGHSRNLSEYYAYVGDRPFDRVGYLLNYAYESGESTGQDPIDSTRHSVMTKADFTLTDQVDLWLKGEASKFEREGSSPTTEDSYRIAAAMIWKPSESHFVQVKGYHYLDDFEASSSNSNRHGDIGYDQIEAQYTWYLSKNQAITTGAEFQRQGIDYIINNTSGGLRTKTTVKEDVDTTSVYAQDELTLFNDLTLVPGIRYDYHSTFGDSVNPKLSAMYRVIEGTNLRGSVGKSFKSPTIRQLYYDVPFYHGPFWIKSNPDLQPEESIGYSAGVEQWLLNDQVVLNLGYFRNDVDDMVVSETSNETFNGQELRIYKNINEAMTQGVEFMAQLLFNNGFMMFAGYTYTDSENREDGTELTWTPEHQFSLTPSYEYTPWGLGGSTTLSYYSKQYSDTANIVEIDPYAIVDAQIYKRIGKLAKVSFQVDNIFDSDKGDEANFRTGRTFIVKLDMEF
jgi:outer membrane receptor for ferrienterochelin and colicins